MATRGELKEQREKRNERILELLRKGTPIAKIRKKAKCSRATVFRVAKKHGFTQQGILTPSDIDKIRRRFEEGWNNAEIGRELGVTREAIRYHRNKLSSR